MAFPQSSAGAASTPAAPGAFNFAASSAALFGQSQSLFGAGAAGAAPLFGQPAAAPAAPPFGAPADPTATPAPTFNASPASGGLFSSSFSSDPSSFSFASASAFGANPANPATPASTPAVAPAAAFGAPAAAPTPASAFGVVASSPALSFGAAASTPASAFGAAASSPALSFGTPAGTPASAFGAPATASASAFGTPAAAPTAAFGAPAANTGAAAFSAPAAASASLFSITAPSSSAAAAAAAFSFAPTTPAAASSTAVSAATPSSLLATPAAAIAPEGASAFSFVSPFPGASSAAPASTALPVASTPPVTTAAPPATAASVPGTAGFSFSSEGSVQAPRAVTFAPTPEAPVASAGTPAASATPALFGAIGSSAAAATTSTPSLFGASIVDSGVGAANFSLGQSSSAALSGTAGIPASSSSLATLPLNTLGTGANSSVLAGASSAAFGLPGLQSGTGAALQSLGPGSSGIVAGTVAKADPAKAGKVEPMNVPSEIGSLSLDEVVNKWTDDVSDLSQQFQKAASMVSKWDRAIVSNEDRLVALHKDSQSLHIAHKELSSNLDVILSQQSELHHLLDALEEDVERKVGISTNSKTESSGGVDGNGYDGRGRGSRGGQSGMGGSAKMQGDVERESMHQLSVEVMEELDAMALTIRDLVGELNKGRDGGSGDGSSDIVGQIISVLNAHLDSLMYLDESSSTLQKRLTDVSRAVEIISRETDRTFGRRGGGLY